MASIRINCPRCGKALSLKADTAPGKLVFCSGAGGDGHTFPYLPAPIMAPPPHQAPARPLPPPPPRPPALAGPEEVAPPSNLAFPLAIAAGVLMIVLSGAAVFGMRALLDRPQQRADRSADKEKEEEQKPSPRPKTGSDDEERDTSTPRPAGKRRRPLVAGPVIKLPPELQDKVNEAVRRGVEFLKNNQQGDGTWPHAGHPAAHAALPGLTLLECGVPATDPRIQAAAKRVRAGMDEAQGGQWTYSAALMLLFLERLEDPADDKRIRTLGLRFVAAQNADGGWGYNLPILSDDEEEKLQLALEVTRPKGLEKIFESPGGPGKIISGGEAQEALDALPNNLRKLPVFQGAAVPPDKGKRPGRPIRKRPPPIRRPGRPIFYPSRTDNSNTQFAALALWAALRRGVPMERSLQLLAKHFRDTQMPDGGWGYMQFTGSTDAMTGAGLLGLAIGAGLTTDDGRKAAKKDEKIEKGLAKLGSYIQVNGAHTGPHSPYFWWTVERVAMLYGVKEIGGKDWYGSVAQLLVAQQREHKPAAGAQSAQGYWQMGGYHGSNRTLDTCFALLVLKRVNLAPELTRTLEGRLITGK